MRLIGIDIGTTSICLVCFEKDSIRPLLILRRQNVFLPGTFEQDPEEIINKVIGLLAEVPAAGIEMETIDAIGISGQMHGILYVDQEGRAVSPFFTWKDEKGKQYFRDGYSYERYLESRTGYMMCSGFGMVTHFYLKMNGMIPETALKAAGIGDYLAMRLTGRKSPLTDITMGASLGGFDLRKRNFDFAMFEQAGVDTSFLPQLSRPGEIAGYYLGIPVSPAYGDNQASFYGALDKPEVQISINVGTGAQVSLFDRDFMQTDMADIRPFFHKGFLYVGASLNGGKVYEKLAAFFEETVFAFTGLKINAFEQMSRLGGEIKETDLMIRPSLYGFRGMDESARGQVENLTADNFHPAGIIRGYVKGMADELYQIYEKFPDEMKKNRKEIIASGNGIRKNLLLAEEVEKRFGMPVILKDMEEEAAVGAALAASACLL